MGCENLSVKKTDMANKTPITKIACPSMWSELVQSAGDSEYDN